MKRIIQNPALASVLFIMILAGNVWGGWFSFEPNMLLLEGTAVARELKDIQKETAYREKGDTAQVDQLVRDAKIIIIDSQKYETRVEYVKFKEQDENIFVLLKDESGSKMWANMKGLACQGADGSKHPVSETDLARKEFIPLSE